MMCLSVCLSEQRCSAVTLLYAVLIVVLSWCSSGGSLPDHSGALQAVPPAGRLHRGRIPQLAVQLHRGLRLPLPAGTPPGRGGGPHFSSHLLTLLSAPSDVRRVLLLPGVRQRLSVGGRLRVRGDPRDQEQDLHGDQPHVLQEGAGGGDAGPDERGPAAAEEDERLRWGGAHVAGVRQLFVTQVASTRDHVQVLNCAETCRI